MINIAQNKEQCIGLLNATHRKGMSDVINHLEQLGFFEAPASAGHHLNEPGGLVQHSLNVYRMAMAIRLQLLALKPELAERLSPDSIAIAALLHDVCKAEIYKPAIKKRKTPQGYWQDYAGYDVDYGAFPIGHGEKSVIQLLRWGVELTDDEMLAIRWHMTAWDLPFQSYEAKECLNRAKENSPLLTLVQAGDGLSSSIIETD